MYRLSKEAKEILERKSQALRISKSRVLEWMIMEFSPSTYAEREIQRVRKYKAEEEYLGENADASLKRAWRNGWATGWLHFQIRKSTHPFKLEN